jgi:phage tail tape-measure protein
MTRQMLRILLPVALLCAPPIFADIVTPSPPNYWQVASFVDFNSIVVDFTSGPSGITGIKALNNFLVPGWPSQTYGSPQIQASANGTATMAQLFRINFGSGSPASGTIAFTVKAYNSGTLVASYDDSYNIATKAATQTPVVEITSVPEASTALMRGGWLLGIALLIFRRKMSGVFA